MWSVITECAYLIPHLHICSDWLITKKANNQEFFMGYSDETWYVGSGGYKNNPCESVITNCAYLIPHLHICYIKRQISRALLDIPPKAAHAVYSVNIASHLKPRTAKLNSNFDYWKNSKDPKFEPHSRIKRGGGDFHDISASRKI